MGKAEETGDAEERSEFSESWSLLIANLKAYSRKFECKFFQFLIYAKKEFIRKQILSRRQKFSELFLKNPTLHENISHVAHIP